MKKSTFFIWTMTFLLAFVTIHISAIFYIANNTEMEATPTQASRSTIEPAHTLLANAADHNSANRQSALN